MVHKIGYMLFGFIALLAVGGMIWSFTTDNVSGGYAAAGPGKYMSTPQIVQLSPADACKYVNCDLHKPITVFANNYGMHFAICDCSYGQLAVPLKQTIKI